MVPVTSSDIDSRIHTLLHDHAESVKPMIERAMALSVRLGSIVEMEAAVKAFKEILPQLTPATSHGVELAITMMEKRLRQLVVLFDEAAEK